MSHLRLPWWLNPWAEIHRLRALIEQPRHQRRAHDRRRRSRRIRADLDRFKDMA